MQLPRVKYGVGSEARWQAGARLVGFRLQDSEFGVSGFGFWVLGFGFRVQGSGFRVQGLESEFRVEGLRLRVQSSGFRVKRLELRV